MKYGLLYVGLTYLVFLIFELVSSVLTDYWFIDNIFLESSIYFEGS